MFITRKVWVSVSSKENFNYICQTKCYVKADCQKLLKFTHKIPDYFLPNQLLLLTHFSLNSCFKGSSKQEAQAYLRLCAHGLSWTVNVCIDLKFSCGVVSWSLAREKSIEFNSNNKWLSGYVMVIYLTACFRTSKYCLQQIATYGWETRIF